MFTAQGHSFLTLVADLALEPGLSASLFLCLKALLLGKDRHKRGLGPGKSAHRQLWLNFHIALAYGGFLTLSVGRAKALPGICMS